MTFECDGPALLMDNSDTKKPAVSRTYRGADGYTPIAAIHLGNESWSLGPRKTVRFLVSQPVVRHKVAVLTGRRYISSRKLSAEERAETVRAHSTIQSQLQWILDVCFGEDGCMIRKDNAPQNLSLLKKIAWNLVRADKIDPAKKGLRLKRKRAAGDNDIRM